jgi:hypothetical protein
MRATLKICLQSPKTYPTTHVHCWDCGVLKIFLTFVLMEMFIQHHRGHDGGERYQVEDILSALHVIFVSNYFLELFWTLLMGIYNLMLIKN